MQGHSRACCLPHSIAQCCACLPSLLGRRTVLDLEPVLEHVVAHLTWAALQQLRSTCRALRTHVAILSAVTKARAETGAFPPTAADMAFLGQFPNLRRLAFWEPRSSPWLHRLSSLPHLHRLKLGGHIFGQQDLQQLSEVKGLRSLCLRDARPTNLGTLVQLTKLTLKDTDGHGLQLSTLTNLQQLTCGDEVGNQLSGLTALTYIDMRCSRVHGPGIALGNIEQLPALNTLLFTLWRFPLTSQLRLATVSTLLLDFHSREQQDDLDLTVGMPALARLSLDGLNGGVAVAAPTVTRLQLSPPFEDICQLPFLAECTRLSVLQLNMSHSTTVPAPNASWLLLEPDRLPAQAVHIEAWVTPPGRIFSPHGHAPCIQLSYVDHLGSLLETSV